MTKKTHICIAFFVVVSAWLLPLLAEHWSGQTAQTQDLRHSVLRPPLSAGHPLGTDHLGRDVALGLLQGWRVAVWLGLSTAATTVILGLIIGFYTVFSPKNNPKSPILTIILRGVLYSYIFYWLKISWLSGQTQAWIIALALWIIGEKILKYWIKKDPSPILKLPTNAIFSTFLDILQSFPILLLLLWAARWLSDTGYLGLWLVLVSIQSPHFIRLSRAEMRRSRTAAYIENAQLLGISGFRLLWRHILPNILPLISATGLLAVAQAIVLESVCAYLGFGVPPEYVTWGHMLQIGQEEPTAWWLSVLPSSTLFFSLFGLQTWALHLNKTDLERNKAYL